MSRKARRAPRREPAAAARRAPAVAIARAVPPPPVASRAAPALPVWLVGALLVAATAVAYLPALGAGFVWDDDRYVTGNVALRTLDGLRRIWLAPGATPQYYPLTFTSFWLERHLFGTTAAPHHLTNVLLHALNALLVWRILARLAVPGAALAAALFALHPVHVESVAWIAERKNVLSGACFLGALDAYLPVAGLVPGSPTGARRALALVLFAAALLAKTVACTWPVAVLILVWWKRGRVGAADVRPLLPFFAVGAALGGVTIWMERHHVGAVGADWALSPAARVLVAGRAVWFYLAKLVWPWPLSFVYARWTVEPARPGGWLFPALAIAGLSSLAVLARRRRAPLAAAAFFVATLAPALGFVDVYPMRYTFVADHYQYLASLGPLVLVAAALARWRPGAPGVALGVALALVLGARTWSRVHVYRDAETLWRDTLVHDPRSMIAHVNLGMELQQRGRTDEAIAEYRAALAVEPGDADAHADLGSLLAARGDTDGARAELEVALRADPDHAVAHVDLGNVLASRNELDGAIAEYRAALRARPAYPDAHANLANVLVLAGRVDEGLGEYAEALRLDPDYVDAHRNYATVLASRGATADAAAHYREVLRLRPGDRDAAAALTDLGR